MSPTEALVVLDRALEEAEPEAVPGWILALTARMSTLAARTLAQDDQRSSPIPAPTGAQDGDQLIGIPEAAKMLGVKVRWVRDHLRELPAVRLSERQIRFDPQKLRRWLSNRPGGAR